MKYLKSNKKTKVYNQKGEVAGIAEVSLKITGRGYDDVSRTLSVHHTYTEQYDDGTTKTRNDNKTISYAECDALAVIVAPLIPEGLGDMEEQQFKVLIAAKKFFADSYADIDVADIEIFEEVEPKNEEQNGEE